MVAMETHFSGLKRQNQACQPADSDSAGKIDLESAGWQSLTFRTS